MGFFDGAAGGIAGAVGSIAGGALGLLGSSQANAANAAAANLSYQQQKEFAQNGIRWRVADAKAAGIHPLAALGAMPANYTPAASVANPPDFSFLADAGQSIGRAMDAKRTQEERVVQQAKQDILAAQQMESNRLDNEYKQTLIDQTKQDMVLQLARSAEMAVRTQGQVPPMPSFSRDGSVMPGQANSTSLGIKAKPAEIVVNELGRRGQERGSVTELGFTRTNDGGYAPVMSKDAKDRLDDDFIGSTLWHMRNSLAAAFDVERTQPPKSWLPKDSEWRFDWTRGAYYPVPAGSGFWAHTKRDLFGSY